VNRKINRKKRKQNYFPEKINKLTNL